MRPTTFYGSIAFSLISLALVQRCPAQAYNARTDVTPQSYPGTIPCPSGTDPGCPTGALTGAGYCFSPSDFNHTMCRVTDASTYSPAITANHSFLTDAGGSAETNLFSSDDTRFVLADIGTNFMVYQLDPSSGAFSQPYTTYSIPGCGAGGASVSPFFSFTVPKVAYSQCFNASSNPIIARLDFTSSSVGPTVGNGGITSLVDLSTCDAALTGVGFSTSTDSVTVSGDDQTFATLVSTTTGQGSSGAIYVVVWNRTLGCRVWNTNTNLISGGYGGSPTGAVVVNGNGVTPPFTGAFTLHNVRLGKGGTWVKVACEACSAANYLWNINTLQVYELDNDSTCGGGHTAIGYSSTVNQCNGFGHPVNFFIRTNTTPGAHTSLPGVFPTDSTGPRWDGHLSWNNDNSGDTAPFLLTEVNGQFLPNGAWDNELLMVAISGGLVYRLAHTFATNISQFFAPANAIANISADGKWAIWTTDFDGKLGKTDSVTTACTIGVNCRADVMLMQLLGGTTFTSGTTVTSGVSIK